MQTPPSIALGIFDLGVALSVPANSNVLSDQKGKTPFNQLLAARQLADLDGADSSALTADVDSESTEITTGLILSGSDADSDSGNNLIAGGNSLPVAEFDAREVGALNITTNPTLSQVTTPVGELNKSTNPSLLLSPIALARDGAPQIGASAAALALTDKAAVDRAEQVALLSTLPGKDNIAADASRPSGLVDSTRPPAEPLLRAPTITNQAKPQGEIVNTGSNSNTITVGEPGLAHRGFSIGDGNQGAAARLSMEAAATRLDTVARTPLVAGSATSVVETAHGNKATSAVDNVGKNSLPEQASNTALLATAKSPLPPQGESLKSLLQGNIPQVVASNTGVGSNELMADHIDRGAKHVNIVASGLAANAEGLVKQGVSTSSGPALLANAASVGETISTAATSNAVAVGGLLSSAGNEVSKKINVVANNVDINFEVEGDGELMAAPRLGDGPRVSSSTTLPTISVAENALTDSKWAPAFSARIAWMASSGVHQANIQLHPAELGAISVQIQMQGDNATVQFQTQTAETQDLIEKLLPRLTAGMEGQGLRLDEAKVSHNSNLQDDAGGATKFADAQNSNGNDGAAPSSEEASSSTAGATSEAGDDGSQPTHLASTNDGSSSVDYYA